MLIPRYWSETYIVQDEWNYDAELVPSRLSLNYPKFSLETNSLGFRFSELDLNSEREVILTLGGSTTFGHYCSLKESWPSILQTKTDLTIINLGQPKADIWQSFIVLIDFIRTHPKLKIKMIITYDGVNQNAAYGHFMRDSEQYQLEHMNYRLINRELEIFKQISENKFQMENLALFLFGKKFKRYLINQKKQDRLPVERKPENCMDKFVLSESEFFFSTLNLLREFSSEVLKAKFFHFLEPTLFDFLPDTFKKQEFGDYQFRRRYYDKLYKQISLAYPEQQNLRSIKGLTCHDFIDFAHLTPRGYAIIAKNIWDVISNSLIDIV